MGCSSTTLPKHDPFEKKRIEYKNSEKEALELVSKTEKSDGKICVEKIESFAKVRKCKPIIESYFKNLDDKLGTN